MPRPEAQASGAFVYNLLSDGELNEGSTWEAAMSASHWKLDNLIALVDVNNQQADGASPGVLGFEPLAAAGRPSAGRPGGSTATTSRRCRAAFDAARASTEPKPRVLICDTLMGRGVPFLESRDKTHFIRVDADEWGMALEQLDAGRHA